MRHVVVAAAASPDGNNGKLQGGLLGTTINLPKEKERRRRRFLKKNITMAVKRSVNHPGDGTMIAPLIRPKEFYGGGALKCVFYTSLGEFGSDKKGSPHAQSMGSSSSKGAAVSLRYVGVIL